VQTLIVLAIAAVAFLVLMLVGAGGVIVVALALRARRRKADEWALAQRVMASATPVSAQRPPGSYGVDFLVAAKQAGLQGAGVHLENALGQQEITDTFGRLAAATQRFAPPEAARPNG
jgi:hypothetical protein